MEEYLEIIPTCVYCDTCAVVCPEEAVIKFGQHYSIDTWSCTFCMLCVQACPVDAIKTKKRPSLIQTESE